MWVRLPPPGFLARSDSRDLKRYLAGPLAVDGSDLVVVQSARKGSDVFLMLIARLRQHHPRALRIQLVGRDASVTRNHRFKKLDNLTWRVVWRLHREAFVRGAIAA